MAKKGVSNRIESEIKKLYSKQAMIISAIVIVIGVGVYFGYFYFYAASECSNIECYENALNGCNKVWVLNEDDTYVWKYEILGDNNKGNCDVEVELIKIKEGKIDAEGLERKTMVCNVNTNNKYPEKDMISCSGVLREEFQEIIIDRMHDYILQNLGEISNKLKQI